jgi:SAM-dependent methyltransferase
MSRSGAPADTWAEGDAYEKYMGRWSRLASAAFLNWLAIPAGKSWLDVGCGTGALTSVVLERAQPMSVVGIDGSAGFVAHAQRRVDDPRASFRIGDALDLPFAAGSFDAVVSGLVLNFVSAPNVMVREMARVCRPGGIVAAYVWDYAGEMQFIRTFWDAATTIDPGAIDLGEGRRFPLCQPRPLHELFVSAGLTAVRVIPVDIRTVFRDFDDMWTPFLGAQGPAPSYVMSLSEEKRGLLREQLRISVPSEPDGSLHLHARAWAVRGTC